LQYVRQDISRYYAGVFTQSEDLVGMVAKRSIRHDAVITPKMVKPKRLIKRGDMITIIAESNGLRIHTKGEALMDGHRGQIIQVKNQRSGRQVSAEVIAQSTVRVKL
jgi:flagella basal body P-ring formation protein FlgA